MLKGKLHMSIITKRLVSIAASTLVLSLVSASANAQTDFHKDFPLGGTSEYNGRWISEYTFHKSMILNSIGFYTAGLSMSETSYSLDTGSALGLSPLSSVDSLGFQWYEFSGGMTINAGQTLKIYTQNSNTPFRNSNKTYNYTPDVIEYKGATPFGTAGNLDWINSNIRVSNPGSNVAPEPGSFALALTGGAALIGICVRRRRNAG